MVISQCLLAQLNIEFPKKHIANFPLVRQFWAVKSVSLLLAKSVAQ